MATAAPTAGPAPAAPAATPATPAGEPNAPQPVAEAAAPKPKQIKPIPPPRLPGVLEDGPEDARSRPPIEGRDAQGRFVKGTKPAGEPKVAEPDGEPVIPEPPEAKPKFKFAGREFDSPEAAEHYVKSMEGRYKPIQEAATRHEAQLVKAAESARGWHAEAQRLQAELAALRADPGAAQPAESTPESTPESKGIDWELYAEISKVAAEAGTPWKAQQWLQEQVDAQRVADIRALREEAIENPRREAEEQAAMAQTADTLVESMVAHKNPDGSPTFPELADDQTQYEVGALWQSIGLDPRLALTPGGAVAAVALYRMARSMNAAPPPAAPASVPSSPPPPDPAAEAAAGLEGGRPLLPAASPRRELDPSVARLVAGLKNTQLIRPGLGFEL